MAHHENEELHDQSGDPGRTPGAAEGDRETVEADLREKENEQGAQNSGQNDRDRSAAGGSDQ